MGKRSRYLKNAMETIHVSFHSFSFLVSAARVFLFRLPGYVLYAGIENRDDRCVSSCLFQISLQCRQASAPEAYVVRMHISGFRARFYRRSGSEEHTEKAN
jgi:hypothetical protein